MTIAVDTSGLSVAWWKEPTKDQWFAWAAAWLGWILDAFDFTIFLFLMAPIAKEFGVSVTAVAVGPGVSSHGTTHARRLTTTIGKS